MRHAKTNAISSTKRHTYTPGGGRSSRDVWSTSNRSGSFEHQEKERYNQLARRRSTNEFLKKSPFVPSSLREYLAHRSGTLEEAIETEKLAIAAKQEQIETRGKSLGLEKIEAAFGKKQLTPEQMYFLDQYCKWQWSWVEDPADAKLVKSMDTDLDFRAYGEFLLGNDLVNRL